MNSAAKLLLCFALVLPACTAVATEADEDMSTDELNVAAPKTVFSGAQDFREVASDGSFAYWTESATKELRRIPLVGGVAPTTLWKGRSLDALGSLVLDSGFVYFIEDGRILKVPSAGGDAQELIRLRDDFPVYLATDADYAYWAGETDNGVDYSTYIRRVKKTGGAIETVYTGYQSVSGIEVKGGYVYFAGSDGTVQMNPPQRLVRVATKPGGTLEVLLEADGFGDIATDGSRVYFVAIADHKWTIQSVPLAGGALPTKLFEITQNQANRPDNLAVGEKSVFWSSASSFDFSKTPADQHTGRVYRVNKETGGRRRAIAANIASPTSFVMAGSCPAWTGDTDIQTVAACE